MKPLDPQWFWDHSKTEDELWPVVCVDLDGVLNDYKGWNGEVQSYPPAPGAHAFMLALYARYKTVVVFTATMPLEKAMQWLEENSFSELVDYVTNHKIPASVYIDDRAVTHTGNFVETLQKTLDFKPHWEGK